MRQKILLGLLLGLVLFVVGSVMVRSRLEGCQYVPLLADERLPNASLAAPAGAKLPDGWSAKNNGVELRGPSVDGQGFALGDGRALQLIGINNYVQTPPAPVSAGRSYCFVGRALTDSAQGSATRLRAVFRWLDASGAVIGESAGAWQKVALWQPNLADWSAIYDAFQAPDNAASVQIQLQPASDDRLYLDDMHVRWTATDAEQGPAVRPPPTPPQGVAVLPWPKGASAALSFSFDWETTMGGLVHTRSDIGDDPNNSTDPITRGLRMRQGVTTTLDLFRPARIQATYYATGYNFLLGNTERQTFMDDPTFAWASKEHGWTTDWSTRRWFSTDPYGTIADHPEYYFGDLVPRLQVEKQAIESHTFSHMSGSYAAPNTWRADIAAWEAAAADRGVPPASSLAFPWSSSAGMSDASWRALEDAGITSVTRTNRRQEQYQLVDRQKWQCQPVPAHATILACPDFYLTTSSKADALKHLDEAIVDNGMIDLWAHTEEVTTPEQIAAWGDVVHYAAQQRDAGVLWIAPLAEITAWQQALAQVQLAQASSAAGAPLAFTVINNNPRPLPGFTLSLPFAAGRYTVNGTPFAAQGQRITIDVPAGRAVEVAAWPA